MSYHHHHDKLFEELIPVIEENVRENDMLEPVAILRDGRGHQIVMSMREFFGGSNEKDWIVPFVDALFEADDRLHLVALISECWMAKAAGSSEKEVFDEHLKAGVQVRDMPGRVDGVMVSIYSRDRRDKMFALTVKPGRAGVEKHSDWSSTSAKGRLARHKLENN